MNFLSRRNFLKVGFLSSLIMLSYKGELFAATTPLQTIVVVQRDLFTDNLPTMNTQDVSAGIYLSNILSHSRVRDEDKEFIKDGAKWLNEEAIDKYEKIYEKLSPKQRDKVLKEIVESDWGESWLAMIMTYIMEAMLGDPIYGGNVDESGWKWLNHVGGTPRPTKAVL